MSKKNIAAGRVKVDMKFKEAVKQKPRGKFTKGKPEQPEYKKVFYPVWVAPKSSKPADPEKFVWPEFKTDRERIKAMSKRFGNTPISEAFAESYGVKVRIKPELEALVNSAPTELRVGDYLEMPILRVSKDSTEFNSMNLKQVVHCNTNLYRYENFKKFIPKDPLKVKVVAANHDRITVDPLVPMLEDWVNPITTNPEIQKVMAGAQTIVVKDLRLVNKGGFIGKAVIPGISKYLGEDYTIEAFIPGSQIVLNIESDFNKWVGKSVEAFVTSYMPKPNTVNQMSLVCSVKEYLKFQGEQNLIKLFNTWCDADKAWEEQTKIKYEGIVTGPIHTAKKCGVFVEIPELHITGFVSTTPAEVVEYKIGQPVTVTISDIEEDTYYDEVLGKKVHQAPYTVENGILTKCSIKPVLQFA